MSEPKLTVLIHGFLGSPSDWDRFLDDWRARGHEPRRFVAVDLSLCRSERALEGEAQGTLAGVAESVVAQVRERAEPNETFDVVGYSLGGRVALAMCCSPTDVGVGRVVLVSSHPGIDDPRERQERARRDDALAGRFQWVAEAADQAEAIVRARTVIREWYAQPLFDSLRAHRDYAAVADRRAQWLSSGSRAAAWAAILKGSTPGRTTSQWSQLSSRASQLRAIVGARDARYLALVPRLREQGLDVEVIPDAGHAIHVEAPAALIDAVSRGLSIATECHS